MNKVNIKNIIARQLPEFIRDESSYANFVLFLEAYYDFLQTQDNRDIESVHSIDENLDTFITSFKHEYNLNNINYTGNQALFYRYVKDLYSAKGSEASYSLLFRLLFNKSVDIIYPNDYVLRPSDGKWIQDIGLFVDVSSGDVFDLVGHEVKINTQTTSIKVFVEKVLLVSGNIHQVFINKNYNGTISIGDVIQYNDVIGVIKPTTSRLKIEQSGAGFKLGQLFDIETETDSGTKIKITKIGPNGEVKAAQIIQYGLGYDTEFLSDIANEIIQTTDSATSSSTNVDATDFTAGFIDSGYASKLDYFNYDFAEGTYVGEILTTFLSNSNVSGNPNACVIRFYPGALCRYPGYFATNEGFLDDAIYIQDSKYYQAFSYVVRIEEQLKSYKDIVKSFIHPAGTIMFAEYEIYNMYDLSLSLQSLIGILRLNFVDEFSTSELVTKSFGKVLTDSFTQTDSKSLTFTTAFADSFTQSDSKSITTTKVLADSLSGVSETINSIDTTKVLADSFTQSDTTSLTTTKVLADSFTQSDTTSLTTTKSLSDSASSVDSGGYTWFNPYTSLDYYAEDYSAGKTTF